MTFANPDFTIPHATAVCAFTAADHGPEPAFLAAGSEILTHRGPVAIEALVLGDLVLTADHGYQELRWIGQVQPCAADLARQPGLTPIRIKRGALAPQQPAADLLVSAAHRLLLRGPSLAALCQSREALVAARDLLSFDGVELAEDLAELRYYQLGFDCHEILFANGAMTESVLPGPETPSPRAKPAKAAGAQGLAQSLSQFLAEPQPPVALWQQGAPCASARPLLSRRSILTRRASTPGSDQ